MNMDCLDKLEALSALVDGEVSPSEKAELEKHLAGCPECRSAYEAMAGLGSQLAGAALPPLASNFVQSTASFVRQSIGSGLPPVAPPRGPNLWNRARQFWNHPVRQLASPVRRRQLGIGPKDAFRLLCLFGLPTFVLSMLSDSAQLQTFLGIATLGLLIGIPARHFSAEVSILGSLRRGRCLEEILGTGVSTSSMVDVLATQGLGELLKACLSVLPVLLLGSLALPYGIRTEAVADELCWMPGMVILFLAGSYMTQFFMSWSGATPVVLGGTLLMAFPLLKIASVYDFFNGSDPYGLEFLPQIGCLILMAIWVGMVGRALALRGLNHPEWVERCSRGLFRSQRSHSLEHFSQNPITRRELARVSDSRLSRVVLWRVSLAVVPLAWAYGIVHYLSYSDWGNAFWATTAALAYFILVRSANRTLPAVVREREGGSWETLLQTPIGLMTFVSGWLQVAFYTVFFETLFAVMALLLFGLSEPDLLLEDHTIGHGLWDAALVALTLLGANLIGATLGLAISAGVSNTREAGTKLLRVCFTSTAATLLIWAGYIAVFMPSMLDSSNKLWLDLLWHEVPMASLVTVGLGLWLWSWKGLRRDLLRVEPVGVATKTARFGGYPTSLFLLELSSAGFLAYASMLVTYASGCLNGNTSNSFSSIEVSFAILVMVAIWLVLIRLPLATLAELNQGSAWSLLSGAISGMMLGASMPLLAESLCYMWLNHVLVASTQLQDVAANFGPVSATGWCLAVVVGGTIGVISGGYSQRARSIQAERREQLRWRLRWSSALTLGSLVLTGGWIKLNFSAELDTPQANAAHIQAAEARAQASREVPRDSNGYTLLKPMLNYRGPSLPDNQDALRFWRELGNLNATGLPKNRQEALAALSGPKVELARQHFESVLPTLEQALARPQFQVPQELDFGQRAPNYVLVRTIGFSLAGLGLNCESKGDWDGALDAYLLGLKWGSVWSGKGLLIQDMIGIAVEAIQLHRLTQLETARELTPEQNRRIIRAVEESTIRPVNLSLSLENELATEWHLLGQNAARRGQAENTMGLPLPEFYLHYERVALANSYNQLLKLAVRMDYKPFELEVTNGHNDNQRYPLAVLTHMLMPNIGRAGLQFDYTLTRLQALRTVAALRLYHHDHGNWPATLDALVGPYLSSAPVCYFTPDRRFNYRLVQGQPVLSSPQRVFAGGKNEKAVVFFPDSLAENS